MIKNPEVQVSGHLFISVGDHQSPENFAERLYALLSTKIKEQRYSENVPGGSYFVGEALGLRIALEYADYADLSSYEYLLSFTPLFGQAHPHSLDGFADLIGKYLAHCGLIVARPLQFGKPGTPIIEYGPVTTDTKGAKTVDQRLRNVDWLEPWVPVEAAKERSALEIALHRELGVGHILRARYIAAIARRHDQDDVLFSLENGHVAEVHLTWRGRPEEDKNLPRTQIFPSIEAWGECRMKPAHEEYRGDT